MKVRINPDKGTFKIRLTLGDAVNVGMALATVKFVYEFADSFYRVSLRRLTPQISKAVDKAEEKIDELITAEKEKSDD